MRAYVFESGTGCIVVVAHSREQAIVMAADDGNIHIGELVHVGLTFKVKSRGDGGEYLDIEEMV